MNVKFIDVDMSKFNREALDDEGKENIMAAELEVTTPDGKVETVKAEQKFTPEGMLNIPVKINPYDNYTFYLLKMSVSGETMIDIAISDDNKSTDEMPETLVLTASIKPFINLVWGGTVVMVLGFYFSLFSRYRKLKPKAGAKN
jgi:cytochrome c biogenesis factor